MWAQGAWAQDAWAAGSWLGLGGPTPPSITILGPAAINVVQGRTLALQAVIDGSPEPSVVWASDDEEVATVDENGVVTGVAIGTATITATATNDEGEDSDSIVVTVREASPVRGGTGISTALSVSIGI